MRRIVFIAILCASGLLYTGTARGDDAPSGGRPNVVLIMTDDQGYGDFGATGNPVVETPHIDAMAARSASMANFYVSPVCTPTRASLMTGRYNYRTRAIDTYIGRAMMEPDETTVAEVLADAGYATGIFGKWHLGDCFPMRAMDQGFRESLVHRGGGLAQPSEPRENNRRYTDPILFHNGKQVQTKGYCTDVYFDAALEFIERSQQSGENFFTYIATNAPHGPYHDVPEDLRKRYLNKDLESLFAFKPPLKQREQQLDNLARIAAMITNVDQNVGRLFTRLRELELLENTLVIFLVDNGPNTHRYVGPWRGAKSQVYEGGIRSPLWLHWPARLPPGTSRDQIAAHIDLMPTILAACGVAIPDGLQLDGRSLMPLLDDPAADWPARHLVIQSHRGDVPTRYHHFMIRDSRYKLVHPSGFSKERFVGQAAPQLYDLHNDPRESNDLAAAHPEIVTRLTTAYDQWFDDVSTTRPDNFAPPRIHLGANEENPTVLTRQNWRSKTGWGPGSLGHWLVHVTTAGWYDFKISFEEATLGGTLELRAGEWKMNRAMDPGATAVDVDAVELPAGDIRLDAILSQNDKQLGVYQIEVTRVE